MRSSLRERVFSSAGIEMPYLIRPLTGLELKLQGQRIPGLLQALASGVAAGGGFGIAAMIVRNVMKQQGLRAHPESGVAAKVSHPVGR
jgi:hypothetical protein